MGVFLKLEMIWIIADIVNGLMAIPNLIALLGLSGVVVAETKLYFEHWEKVHSRRKQLDGFVKIWQLKILISIYESHCGNMHGFFH